MKARKLLDKNGRRILTRLAIIFVTSFLIYFFLEWRFFGNNFDKTIEFMTGNMLVFNYNFMLLFCINLIISSLFKTPWTGSGIVFIITIIVSYITVQKQAFRGQPFLPEDLVLTDQAGTITKFVDPISIVRTVIAVLIVIALIFLLNYLTKTYFDVKDRTEPKHFWNKNLRIFRATIFVIGVVCFGFASSIARNRTGTLEQEIPGLNSYFVAWNQMINYEKNGFILGFLYNWSKAELVEPGGYSEEKISEIRDSYKETLTPGTEPVEKTEKPLKSADYNIVIVLNESFIDPSILDEYKITAKNEGGRNSMGNLITKDVVPNIRKMIENDAKSKNYATGQMYSIDYGGGTANIEFEVDTTMSTYWMNAVPYVDLLSRIDVVPSIARTAKDAGFETIAFHPFNAGMYKRNLALKTEGFDRFVDETEFKHTDKDENREYINDRAAYSEVLDYLKSTDNKALVSLITMQNHAGYGGEGFENPSYEVDGAKIQDEKQMLEIYLESLHNADAYLGEFLENLEKLDEKTVVLFYGDHAPGILMRINEDEDKNVRDIAQITPYFVWANFDLKDVKYDKITRFRQEKTTLPTTTPNCLTNTMFELLGLEKPTYMKLSSDVCAETPILSRGYFASSAPFKSTALSNYELYIYDILGGKQYWLNKSK